MSPAGPPAAEGAAGPEFAVIRGRLGSEGPGDASGLDLYDEDTGRRLADVLAEAGFGAGARLVVVGLDAEFLGHPGGSADGRVIGAVTQAVREIQDAAAARAQAVPLSGLTIDDLPTALLHLSWEAVPRVLRGEQTLLASSGTSDFRGDVALVDPGGRIVGVCKVVDVWPVGYAYRQRPETKAYDVVDTVSAQCPTDHDKVLFLWGPDDYRMPWWVDARDQFALGDYAPKCFVWILQDARALDAPLVEVEGWATVDLTT